MATAQVIGFWKSVQGNEQLQREIGQGDPSAAVAADTISQVAAREGFDCTADEFRAVEQVLDFWKKVHSNEALQQQLQAAQATESHEAALRETTRVAGEAGFSFTEEQLDQVTKAQIEAGGLNGEDELSDEVLESVAGGGDFATLSTYQQSFRGALGGRWAPLPSLGGWFGIRE